MEGKSSHLPNDNLVIAGRSFSSRLLLGTGKFSSPNVMKRAIHASASEVITVAVRRTNLDDPKDSFTTVIDPEQYLFLPNTSGARNAEEAIKIAEIARFSGVSNWVKLEVISDQNYLFPDPVETLIAAEALVKKGFVVLPYIHADPVLAKRLEAVGCATVMPLAAPIGSNKGLDTESLIQIIIEQATVPIIVDAGLGVPSHASKAMEIGADAVLVNTAIATAMDPVSMATAFRMGVESGRLAFLAGMARASHTASPSSPLTGFLNS